MTPAELLRPLLRGDEHFAVTGATGWFGRTALDLLDEVLGPEAADRVSAYASRSATMRTTGGRAVEVRPLGDLTDGSDPVTHLLHFAFLTRDRAAQLGVGDYVQQNLQITLSVLQAVAGLRPRGLLTTSSGAVYDRAGGLDVDLTSNPYGALKQLDELSLRQAVSDVGGTPVVARVFSVAGRGITKPDLYALGSLVRMAHAGGPLQVRARGPVVRSYTGVDEVIALGLWAVLMSQPTVFDSAGHVVEVGELAELVATLHGLPAAAVERTMDADRPEDRYTGDSQQMQALVQRSGLRLRPLAELVTETSQSLRTAGAG